MEFKRSMNTILKELIDYINSNKREAIISLVYICFIVPFLSAPTVLAINIACFVFSFALMWYSRYTFSIFVLIAMVAFSINCALHAEAVILDDGSKTPSLSSSDEHFTLTLPNFKSLYGAYNLLWDKNSIFLKATCGGDDILVLPSLNSTNLKADIIVGVSPIRRFQSVYFKTLQLISENIIPIENGKPLPGSKIWFSLGLQQAPIVLPMNNIIPLTTDCNIDGNYLVPLL
jgi:hypothetical protein